MKREIKFRVFDQELKEYRTSQGGDYSLGVLSGEVRGKYGEEFPNMIVEQFTGLKDKNGKEIYEGDLILDLFPIDDEDLSKGYYEDFLPVTWCSKTLQWCVDASFEKNGNYLTSIVEYFGEFLEVKGNIYKNPELINDFISNNR